MPTNITWIVSLSSSTKLAATWFGENERVLAVSAVIVAQSLGIALGFAMPAIFFDEDMEREKFRSVMIEMMGWQVVLAAIQTVVNVFIYKEKPDKPAGPLIEIAPEDQLPIIEVVYQACKNWNFVCNVLVYTLL